MCMKRPENCYRRSSTRNNLFKRLKGIDYEADDVHIIYFWFDRLSPYYKISIIMDIGWLAESALAPQKSK